MNEKDKKTELTWGEFIAWVILLVVCIGSIFVAAYNLYYYFWAKSRGFTVCLITLRLYCVTCPFHRHRVSPNPIYVKWLYDICSFWRPALPHVARYFKVFANGTQPKEKISIDYNFYKTISSLYRDVHASLTALGYKNFEPVLVKLLLMHVKNQPTVEELVQKCIAVL